MRRLFGIAGVVCVLVVIACGRSDQYRVDNYKLSLPGGEVTIRGASVTPEFFPDPHNSLLLGRAFASGEYRANVQVVILSNAFWRERFQADPAWVGKTLRLNGKDFMIVGIMPTPQGYYTNPIAAEVLLPAASQSS